MPRNAQGPAPGRAPRHHIAAASPPSIASSDDRVTRDPVPLAECISLLDYSDELDRQLRLRLSAYRQGYAAAEAAHADDYDLGYADGVMARKRAGIRLYEVLQLEQRRWELRGEKRTRRTFGLPHKDDYQPRGGAA